MMTLEQISRQNDAVLIHCHACGRVVSKPVAVMIRMFGPSSVISEIGRKFKCRRCDSRLVVVKPDFTHDIGVVARHPPSNREAI